MRVRLLADREGQLPPYLDFMLQAFYQGQHRANARPREASTTDGVIVIPSVPAGEYAVHVWSLDRPLKPNGYLQVISSKFLGRSDRFEVVDKDVSFDLHISIPGKP